jgi:hypothetical protein
MEKKGVGKIEKGRKIWKQELISTTGSNCGMITPYWFSRIQNIHDRCFHPFGYGVNSKNIQNKRKLCTRKRENFK